MSIKVHGHRGARARWPENTIPGFEYAIRIGADGIEFDVAVTKDEELVLSHDPIRGTSNPGLPTLDDALALAPNRPFEFDVEIKSYPNEPDLTPPPDRFAELVLAAIRRHKVEARVNILSFDFRVLIAMRRIAPELRRSALYEGAPKSFVELSKEAGDTAIVSPHYTLVTPELVAEAHTADIRIMPWTANTPADWDHLIAANVDAIITDDPESLLSHLRKF